MTGVFDEMHSGRTELSEAEQTPMQNCLYSYPSGATTDCSAYRRIGSEIAERDRAMVMDERSLVLQNCIDQTST